jgi:membrane protein DedA with SNARE-associated domain
LELFVFIGSFLEEAISPIPSFVVMLPAGAVAHVQGYGWWFLGVLALFAAAGRVPASLLLYFIADKSENWLFGRGRRIFGVSHKQLEGYGRRFSGSGRDWVILFLINAVPVIPTSLTSLTCGFIKLPLRLFITATFFGTAVNACFYMGAAYAGAQVVGSFRSVESALEAVGAAIIVAALIVWFVYYKKKRDR